MNPIEELRNEYGGLGLSDEQMLHLKSIGLPLEAAKYLIEKWTQVMQDLNKSLEALTNSLKETGSIDALKELGITIQEKYKITQVKRNKKGRPLKPWQKNKFYQ